MKAVIKLDDVPEFQIGQMARVYFPDSAVMYGKCEPASGWISVKDRLPPNAEHPGAFCPRYLVKTEFGVTEGWYNPDRENWFVLLWSMLGRFDLRDIDIERGDRPGVSARVDVTHWMPFPEPPEEEENAPN